MTATPSSGAGGPAGTATTAERCLRTVLVVDDSRLQRRLLSMLLGRAGYRVMEADSGEAALALCRQAPPDLVVSDWMMPGMSGIDLCRALRALATGRYVYFILLTSRSEKAEVAHGLDCGADDLLTKPVDAAELRARLAAGERILRMERELSEKNRLISQTLAELQAAQAMLDADLQQARKIQESLVPERTRRFGESEVNLLFQPCGQVGGDLVGAFSPGYGTLGIYAIDVSGHGVTSALMAARVSGYLSSEFLDQNVAVTRRFERFFALRPPAEVARLLNERLAADRGVEEYFTMVYATVDLRSGRVRLVQAGHPHPMILRADGRREFIGQGGLPVGLLPEARFEEIEARLAPGDRLLLHSDGFTEAQLPDGSLLGDEGLGELVARVTPERSGRTFLDELLGHLRQATGTGMAAEDDISAALLDYRG
ncbi:fused response regulator/phosphatase [Rhodosalinus halophilus]|uniref:Fused response regulator/phosphatase n=1 Tax=Rhodosalinus halophilus TaxID=2259333 RepID=A0A365U7T7_9RHOB|nr:SpoIIE family protein phosphatase [Rhodosalinus halophilus]RBI84738.1 fused response regulator/phosphatase [Rhodosalinus halophilus]